MIVAVFDSAMAAYANPFFAPSQGAASRAFSDEVARPGSEMNKHPADYVLFYFGTFDAESGVFDLLDRPVQVIRAVDCVEVKRAS